ncbi:hypothetical protein [Arthrobacter caoxuetaonis]|uniref:Uncharacterized protein n=1 Tax=Arthrobacter caoxuetaonis TaxID=2886935 RepID=A0A9X1MH14_9MICC|nr:hypothetical protein [Arthrobacter caoxuetaonis]MCC3299661.1 hypothetical protein [Arthrobacter caoxuetaonis]USQ58997.1 hypothetical protein NF551_17990 [Arthrobacter caoxuetaonis]
MTTSSNAPRARVQPGVPAGGQFTATNHAESGVTVGAAPAASPYDQYRESQERAEELLDQIRAVDVHRDVMELDLERASLKSIGLGIKDAYPEARYLRVEEDDNRYWVSGLTDADGDVVPGSEDDLDELELFDDAELSTEVHALSCTDTGWAYEVSPDDESAPDLEVRACTVIIDLDKAAALELAPARTRMDAEVVTAEARGTLLGAVDDALSHLDDIVSERASDYTKDDLDAIRERITDLQRIIAR